MTLTDMRALALQTASGAGLPYDLTLRAARAYLAFLQGKEDQATEWTVKRLQGALLASKGAIKKPAAKKPTKRKLP